MTRSTQTRATQGATPGTQTLESVPLAPITAWAPAWVSPQLGAPIMREGFTTDTAVVLAGVALSITPVRR